ncbi:NAD(P)-dependent oxidoreductase [Actinobacteria bacterium YIM 96077]|uniref:NAD-dependent epimerase/dehydratase domain-containing protein n=1 Tax=Phytoactinopolyspora halophila TaxID=1981511 RepID=A0A329QI15_9ACTN|nr:NAD(P)-dependent oxidoreductase [Phytoactinopolyspora halophila]AYY12408.1 NAD(P)-dependent oxidoreductase [Actinobacteria bacterium YIM 96077]RAW12013.1 hypothetical protein DPM12_15175 [Phytoactinopolyspora halophila]
MLVLVTGATGRVGANMVKRLVSSGAQVKAMVMPGDPQAAKLTSMPEVEIVEADLTDQAAINHACRDVTHVVHLAAQLIRGDTPVDTFYDINALGTLRLLEAVARGNGVERFLLASTDGTYRPGDPPSIPLSEETHQRPADYYGTSKLLGEIILHNHAAQFDIPFTITRFATVLDPAEAAQQFRVHSLRGLLRRAGLGRDSNIWQLFYNHPGMTEAFETGVAGAPDEAAVSLVGRDGESWSIHLLDVRDAVEGLYLALTKPYALGCAFNIAGPAPTRHDDAASIIAETYGVPKVTVTMPTTWRLEMTISKARGLLGFYPRHDFRSMVESASAGSDSAASAGTDPDEAYIPARV